MKHKRSKIWMTTKLSTKPTTKTSGIQAMRIIASRAERRNGKKINNLIPRMRSSIKSRVVNLLKKKCCRTRLMKNKSLTSIQLSLSLDAISLERIYKRNINNYTANLQLLSIKALSSNKLT